MKKSLIRRLLLHCAATALTALSIGTSHPPAIAQTNQPVIISQVFINSNGSRGLQEQVMLY